MSANYFTRLRETLVASNCPAVVELGTKSVKSALTIVIGYAKLERYPLYSSCSLAVDVYFQAVKLLGYVGTRLYASRLYYAFRTLANCVSVAKKACLGCQCKYSTIESRRLKSLDC